MNEYQDSLIQKMSNISKNAQKDLLSKNIELKKKQIKELKRTRMITRVAFVIVLFNEHFHFYRIGAVFNYFCKNFSNSECSFV